LEIDKDQPALGENVAHSEVQKEFSTVLDQAVLRSLDLISKTAQSLIPDDKCATLSPQFFERILMLGRDLPPSCPTEDIHSFGEILSAAWAYHLLRDPEFAWGSQASFNDYEKTNRLILKAIELIPISQAMSAPARHSDPEHVGITKKRVKSSGVLSRQDITRRLNLPIDDGSCLAVVPLDSTAVKAASLKVHLGNWFSYARRTRVSNFRIGDLNQQRLLSAIGRDEVFVAHNKDFLLHPGDLVLGVTQEFFGFPNNLMAFVEGLSALGRLGLFVATATQVAPGFHGVLVLELVNAGTVPLQLLPGMEIAQLVFQTLTEPVSLDPSENRCPIKP